MYLVNLGFYESRNIRRIYLVAVVLAADVPFPFLWGIMLSSNSFSMLPRHEAFVPFMDIRLEVHSKR